MTTFITPTGHEKAEWARLAQDAYSRGLNHIGHKFSAAASLPRACQIDIPTFDAMQKVYRAWLIDGVLP